MNFFRNSLAITWKDLISEMRTKEIVFTVLVFSLLVIVIFSVDLGLLILLQKNIRNHKYSNLEKVIG